MRLIAPRGSRRAFEVRDLLERNLLPVRFFDVDTDEESASLLKWLDIPRSETPVLVHATDVMRNPSAAQVARSLHLRADVEGERFDLVVLGGGPAGLAAAVYGGSEGLRTFVAEAWAPGGQAGTSTRIENYLGFPTGISGTELTRNATLQARRFDAVLSSFHRVVELADGPEGLLRVDLDDGQYVLARSIVMATGARWRELDAEGIDRFRGAGVYHAAMPTDAERSRDEDVIVVGGGNSAGQAAMHLASLARSVRIVVRGNALTSTMSRYLLDRIERSPRIEVMTETEVAAVHGTATVESVSLRDRRTGTVEPVAATAVFVMIGAVPCTEAAQGMLAVDPAGYLLCGNEAAGCDGQLSWPLKDRAPHLLETIRPGVFTAGDVRAGSTNRVAGAVGDGALAVRFAHEVLAG
jgi:thioredoxin reductase (NADPH)